VLFGNIIEFLVCLLCTSLLQNKSINLLLFVLGEAFKAEISILRKNVSSEVKVILLALEQQQIAERFRGEGRVVQKKVELLEAFLRCFLHPYQCLLCKVTGSISSSFLGGMSKMASLAAGMFFIWNSIAAFKLNASISADSLRICEFPTEFTVFPSS